MNKSTKQQITNIILDLTTVLSRGENPDVSFDSKLLGSSAVMGHYNMDTNTLVFRASWLCPAQIAHEVAHWQQYQLESDTACLSTNGVSELAARHSELEKSINSLMDVDGTSEVINSLLG